MTHRLHLGALLFPQHTTWEQLRDHALLLEELGYDSLWTWDHFVPLQGDERGPYYEGWSLITAWGALTKRIRIGTLVTGVTYRHPAVLARMAITLDHITGGRVILGLGAAWHKFEHDMYGIPFDSWTVRFEKLEEACRIARSLAERETTTLDGKHFRLTDAFAYPKPVQRRLPLLIGGGGEKKTLRITAQYADMWHGFGTPEEIARKIDVLREHCADVGRDPSEILPLSGLNPGVVIRDDPDAVGEWLRAVARTQKLSEEVHHTTASAFVSGPRLRTVEEVVRRMLEYWRVGVRGFILGFPPPFDRESMERVAREVRPRVEAELAA